MLMRTWWSSVKNSVVWDFRLESERRVDNLSNFPEPQFRESVNEHRGRCGAHNATPRARNRPLIKYSPTRRRFKEERNGQRYDRFRSANYRTSCAGNRLDARDSRTEPQPEQGRF